MDLHSALRTHRSPPFSWSLRALLLMLVLALAGSALAKKADPEPPPPPPEADPEVMAKFDALLAATTADERTTVARDLWFDASGAAFRDTAQVVYADTSDEGVKRYADLCILTANAFGYTAREWEKSYKLVVNFSLPVYGGCSPTNRTRPGSSPPSSSGSPGESRRRGATARRSPGSSPRWGGS
jgi:hypothetical protein